MMGSEVETPEDYAPMVTVIAIGEHIFSFVYGSRFLVGLYGAYDAA